MTPASPAPLPRQHTYVLRITLQLESPLSLGSGHSTSEFDSPVAIDANGLPYLPGTSIAGTLRALVASFEDENTNLGVDDWFGFLRDESGEDIGLTSPLRISAGHIHDSHDAVLDGMVLPDVWQSDPILGPLASALPHREHVRLNHRGVGADGGKFDRSFVPRGHHFTFQIQLTPYAAESEAWDKLQERLLNTLAAGNVSLGGAKRSGYGRVRAVRAWAVKLDLRVPEQRQQLLLWRQLAQTPPQASAIKLPTKATPLAGQSQDVIIQLPLRACDYWRVGSAANGLRNNSTAHSSLDQTPYREHAVNWISVPARLHHTWVVPGSAIKGALAHRTTFHLNRLEKRWAGSQDSQAPLLQIQALFGNAAGDEPVKTATPQGAGAVWVNDAYPGAGTYAVQPETVTLNHVRIDRYTGGAYGGALFDEEVLFGGGLDIQLRLVPASLARLCPDTEQRRNVVQALQLALADLTQGRLALGAGAAEGLGFFEAIEPQKAQKDIQQFEARCLAVLQLHPVPTNDTLETAA